MSLKTQLQDALAYCNTQLVSKGVTDTATSVVDVGDKIATIQQGGGFPADNYAYINPYVKSLYDDFWTQRAYLPNEFTLDISKATLLTILSRTFMINGGGGTTKIINIIGSTRNITTFDLLFCRQSILQTINGELDFTSMNADTQRVFFGCSALEDVRFTSGSLSRSLTMGDCPNLSVDSLASIVAGLKDLTGATGKTLTLHTTAKAKLTAEQIATITAKNWTLA